MSQEHPVVPENNRVLKKEKKERKERCQRDIGENMEELPTVRARTNFSNIMYSMIQSTV
jgi:hypothetical protein